MKKVIVILLFILPGLFSAETMFGQFSLGVKVGYNASKLSTNVDSVKTSFKSGFQFGAFVRIGKRLYLQPEFYYITQGGVFTNNITKLSQTVKIGSLDVPVLIGVKLFNSKIFNVRILAGPDASFVVNKPLGDGGLNAPSADKLKTVNWGLQAGAGVDVLMFTLDIRYQVGLSNMFIKESNFTSKNNLWVISLGWKII